MLSRIRKTLDEIYTNEESQDDLTYKLLLNIATYKNPEDNFLKLSSLRITIKLALLKGYIIREKNKYNITDKGIRKLQEYSR